MNPFELIGLRYRLGSSPLEHGTGDCFSVAATVVEYCGFEVPKAKREWYRRLRRGDFSVFEEELLRWGRTTGKPRLGVVALCKADNGYGLAVYWSDGWLKFNESEVTWSPLEALQVEELYFPRKLNSVMRLV